MTEFVQRLGDLDARLLLALTRRRRPLVDRFMQGITRLGDPALMLATGTVFLTVGDRLPLPAGVARESALAILLSFLIGQLVKRRVSRPRPVLPVGLHFLVHPPDRFSFPSGHAAAGLALVLPFVFWLSAPWSLLLLGMGLAVGLSRAYLGVHFPGDVVMGWGVAIAVSGLLRVLG